MCLALLLCTYTTSAAKFCSIATRKRPQLVQIVVMDKLDYCATRNNVKALQGLKNFKLVKGDIQSVDLVSHVLERENVDTIMHFAAQVRARACCPVLDAAFGA